MDDRKRLYRSREESMVAGVCGGIAEYLQVDVTLVRLVFVALTLMGGPGIVIYGAMWLIVPLAPKAERKAKREVYEERRAPYTPVRSASTGGTPVDEDEPPDIE